MDRNRIAHLIQKFRLRAATQEEIDELEAFWYLAQTDETLFHRLSDEEKEQIRAAMFENIRDRIGVLSAVGRSREAMVPVSRPWLRVAASIAMIVAISIFWGQYNKEDRTIRTAYGQQKIIQLPDQSIVVINGNTTLQYAAEWGEGMDREVWMDGEAFFEVVHAENDEKFIVHTDNGMDVQVLGTKFNVKSRRGKTEVMLQEGKVRLDVESTEQMASMTLQPGELATLQDSHLSKERIRAAEYSSWKDHKLIFDQTSLREVARILEDTYGMEVVFEDEKLADRKLSGEISSDDVTDILNAIRETFDISVRHDGNKITFHL
jgi:transmembrane sensor